MAVYVNLFTQIINNNVQIPPMHINRIRYDRMTYSYVCASIIGGSTIARDIKSSVL